MGNREKDSINRKMKIISYYDVYKNLLSSNQKDNLSLYCEEDLSLGEIATIHNISRQAVWDSISKGCEQLEKFENVLHIVEKSEKLDKACNKILTITENCKDISDLKRDISYIVENEIKALQEL